MYELEDMSGEDLGSMHIAILIIIYGFRDLNPVSIFFPNKTDFFNSC